MPSTDRVVEHTERLRASMSGLACSRSEAGALAALAVGALLLLVLLWPSPSDGGAAAAPTGDPPPTPHAAADRRETAEGFGSPPATPPAQAALVVHVSGLVARPGVYELAADARVADAIERAGGVLPGAQTDRLNLAAVLSDGEKVHVPGPDDELPAVDGPDRAAWLPDGRLDVNKASAADFEELPGIGPVMAERLVAHREDVGAFASIGDLLEVRGIGEKTLAALADLLAV